MNRSVEKTGKTVDEAVASALQDLGIDEDRAEIEVLDEGSKGLFGLGGKLARVRVTVRDSRVDDAVFFITSVFEKMKIDVEVEAEECDNCISVRIRGKDSGIIIGRRGETLDAIQYLTGLVVNKDRDDYVRVIVDIENYRKKREETLVRLANRLADRVVRYKKNIVLEPMNPFERRIIHSSLQDNKYVETYSIGDEPNRKVVITLKQPAGSI